MVAQAISWLAITKNDRILDLFCGLGNFSLALAQQAQSVVGVEGIQAMVDRARSNAQINQLDNLEFYQADLEQDFTQTSWAKRRLIKCYSIRLELGHPVLSIKCPIWALKPWFMSRVTPRH